MDQIPEKLYKSKASTSNTSHKHQLRMSKSAYTPQNSDILNSPRDIGHYEGTNQHRPFFVPKPIIVKNYLPEDIDSDIWMNNNNNLYGSGTTISPNGIISLNLHHGIRVDITLTQAIRIINSKNLITLSLNSSGSTSGLIHPNGRIYQYGSRVEILVNDSDGHKKFAKMWYKGVSFSSNRNVLVYLVDAAGTRTTTDTFLDLNYDFSLSVFFDQMSSNIDMANGDGGSTQLINEAVNILESTKYWLSDDNTDNWYINNVRISQTADGLVRVGRKNNKFSLRTSPTNGSASITTPFIHSTGSMGRTRHLFVRRGERRMHFDGSTFIVRNAGHSAGFDANNQLKIY